MEKTIRDFGLIKKNDSILVAFSGGPDSTALLYLFDQLKSKYSLKLVAAHLDHGIRSESASDREFCRQTCRSLKIKFHSLKIDIPAQAKKRKLSIEEAGRNCRYEYFQKLSLKYGYARIATGHTSDDNAETVIFNLARGAGLKGLAGIPFKRGAIIRPLLEIEKSELLAWLKSKKIPFALDKSNLSSDYARNRIRKNIIPQFKKLNPLFAGALSRFSRNIAGDLEYLRFSAVSSYENALVKSSNNKIVLDLGKLKGYDKSLRKLTIAEVFSRFGGVGDGLSYDAFERAMGICDGKSGNKTHLGQGIWIEKSQNQVSLRKIISGRKDIKLNIPGITRIPLSEKHFSAEILKRSEIKKLKTGPDTAIFDMAGMTKMRIRFWREGDKIRPLGMRGARLLSDVFTDRKIPTFERQEIPLLISGGEIAWIAGVMMADDFKVRPETADVLRIRLCGS